MKAQFKTALMAGVALSLFASSLLTANADDPAPVAVNDAVTYVISPYGQGFFIDVLDNDTGVGLKVSSVGPAQHGEATIDAGGAVMITYAPDGGFIGVDTFPYTITDANGQTAIATVAVTVEMPDIAAVDDEASYAVWPPYKELAINVCDNDTGIDLRVSSAGPAEHGQVIMDGPSVIHYTPSEGFVGVDTFPYTVTDAVGQTATATVTVTVTFTVDDVAVTVPEGQRSLVFELSTGDINYDLMSTNYSIQSVSEPTHGISQKSSYCPTDVCSIASKAIWYTPDSGFLGTDSFTFTVQDISGNTTSALITVNVVWPFAANDMQYVFTRGSDGMVDNVIPVLNNDIGTGIHLQSVGGATHGGTTMTDDLQGITYVPDQGYYGMDQFHYTIVDADGRTATAAVTVFVMSYLVAEDDNATTPQDTAVEIPVFANDEGYENARVNYISLTPSHGTAASVVCSGADTTRELCIIYTPAPGFTGEDTFTYVLGDDVGGVAGAAVTVIVTSPVQIKSGGSALPPSSAPMALVFVGIIVVAGAFAVGMAHRH